MTTTLPTPCAYGSLQYHPGSSKLVLLNTGNYPAFNQMTLSTWTWNGSDWTLTVSGASANPTIRTECSMAYDGTNLIMFGGRGVPGTTYMNDTWAWNGTVWSNPITNDGYNHGLFGRVRPYMAQMTGGAILFAGKDSSFYNQDTWAWNGSAWRLLSPTNSPTIRVGASFASNGTNKAILFGGANGSFALNDAWSWNGTTWAQLTTNTPPSVRLDAAMCWYPTGSYFLVFGGASGSSNNLLNDTWTFDGVSVWTKLSPANSPSARTGAMMAYDTASGQVILFGGKNGNNLLNDTFTWNGSNWITL